MAKFLGTEPIGKLLAKQSYPAFIGLFVIAMYNLIDTIFIGQATGKLGIAGVTLSLPIQMIVFSFALIIGIGSSSYISRKLGEKKPKLAEKALGNAIFTAFVSGLILTIIIRLFSQDILKLFGASKEVLPFSLGYINFIALGFIFILISVTLNNIARSEGRAKLAMAGMLLSSVINIVLDAIFIFGFEWGVPGAALATVFAHIFATMFLGYFFIFKKKSIPLHFKNIKFNSKISKEVFAIGSSAFFRQTSFAIMTIVLNLILVNLGGDISLAAMGMCQRLVMFVFMPAFGVVQGMTPILGYNYGAKKFERVRETLNLSNLTITVIMLIAFLILMFFPEILFRMFTPERELILLASDFLRTISLGFPFVGITIIASGLYQAIGKAKIALFFSILRQIILQLPLLLILSNIWGLFGLLLSFPISDMASSAITYVITKKSSLYQSVSQNK